MNQIGNNHCLNCQSKIDSNFCSQCGQSTSVHRITFRETIGDFFSSTFALEGQLLSTIKLLFTNPGRLFREFIEGKRKTYYKPVAFFVVLSAAYIIVRATIQFDPLENQEVITNPDADHGGILVAEASRFMVTHINHIMFFLVLSIGIVNKLFFYKKHNLAEYITIGFYIAGIYNLVGIASMIFSTYLFSFTQGFQIILLIAYLVYSSISFHKKKSFGSLIKYFFNAITVFILYAILGFGLSMLIVHFRN